MKKLTYILIILSNLLHFGCNSSIQNKENEEKEIIENYYDILNVIIQDQNSSNNNLVVFGTDSLNSDTIEYRNFKLLIYPHDWFIMDTSKMNITAHNSGYSLPLYSNNFPSINDFDHYKIFSDTVLMTTWDSTKITGCRIVDYGEKIFFLLIGKRHEGDILFASYPLLNTNKDSALLFTSFYTQNNQIDKFINLVKIGDKWEMINKVIFLLEIREQTYKIDESRSKTETVTIFKGTYE